MVRLPRKPVAIGVRQLSGTMSEDMEAPVRKPSKRLPAALQDADLAADHRPESPEQPNERHGLQHLERQLEGGVYPLFL